MLFFISFLFGILKTNHGQSHTCSFPFICCVAPYTIYSQIYLLNRLQVKGVTFVNDTSLTLPIDHSLTIKTLTFIQTIEYWNIINRKQYIANESWAVNTTILFYHYCIIGNEIMRYMSCSRVQVRSGNFWRHHGLYRTYSRSFYVYTVKPVLKTNCEQKTIIAKSVCKDHQFHLKSDHFQCYLSC